MSDPHAAPAVQLKWLPTNEIVQFPLTFCVLPARLIVFLGPPLLSLMR